MRQDNQQSRLVIYAIVGCIGLIGFLLIILATLGTPIKLPTTQSGNINLLTIFLTGLITGGLTCMAVQGGLLAATLAQNEEERLKEKATKSGTAVPILAFLTTKLIAYTTLGFLLGWFGSFFTLSLTLQVILQVAVAIFMIGTALNILNVHPIFRYFVIQPPRFLTRIVRKQSKSKAIFAPALLGALTVFIPCGTTQAMMALAIASGKPLFGAAILFAFILGTSPLFFILGFFATKLGDTLHAKFMRFAAFAIILLALFNLNNAMALSGLDIFKSSSSVSTSMANQPVIQKATIIIGANGYSPTTLTVRTGSQVSLHLNNTGGAGCIQTFTIPSMGIQQSVPLGTSSDISFIAPNKPGTIPFMCSMGMYRGVINVI